MENCENCGYSTDTCNTCIGKKNKVECHIHAIMGTFDKRVHEANKLSHCNNWKAKNGNK